MRSSVPLARLLRVALLLALMVGIVVRPSLSELAERHADEHRTLASRDLHESPRTASHHVDDSAHDASPDLPQGHDDGGGLHALMHLTWAGGAAGLFTPVVAPLSVHLGTLHPWRPLAAAARTVRLPSPLRPPIA